MVIRIRLGSRSSRWRAELRQKRHRGPISLCISKNLNTISRDLHHFTFLRILIPPAESPASWSIVYILYRLGIDLGDLASSGFNAFITYLYTPASGFPITQEYYYSILNIKM